MEHRENSLLVMWTSADREVALKMVMMYAHNARLEGWWQEVTLLIWGPSSRLLSQDTELQEKVAAMQAAGVRIVACKACADGYGVAPALERLGIEVFYTGEFLTEWIKSGTALITI